MNRAISNNPRIVVNSNILAVPAMKLLTERGAEIRFVPTQAPVSELRKAVSEAPTHAILSRATPIDGALMDAAGALRVISKHGVGFDNIDLGSAASRQIRVMRAYAANARSVAELALTMMLVLLRRILPLDAAIRVGKWEQAGPLGRELAGLQLGIVGCGAVGSKVVELGRAFGLAMMTYDPYIDVTDVPAGVERIADLDQLLMRADIVTLHCPLTAETNRMIDAASLALMKPASILINAARGPLVDEVALVEALKSGRIAAAGLDTYLDEPPSADHPLWQLPNVVLTPHIGGSTQEAMIRVAVQAVENIFAVLDGKRPDPRFVVG